MVIENWSIIKENSNNEYCQITDDEKKYIKGTLTNHEYINANIMTAPVVSLCFNEAQCKDNELFQLGKMDKNYKNYIEAKKNNLGVISNWFVYKRENILRIQANLNIENNDINIDEEILSYDYKRNFVKLNNYGVCFLTIESINEIAKQFLITNNKFVDFKNSNITNILDYEINFNISTELNNSKIKKKLKLL